MNYGASDLPTTLREAIRHFSDEMTCIAAVAEMRWDDGKPIKQVEIEIAPTQPVLNPKDKDRNIEPEG